MSATLTAPARPPDPAPPPAAAWAPSRWAVPTPLAPGQAVAECLYLGDKLIIGLAGPAGDPGARRKAAREAREEAALERALPECARLIDPRGWRHAEAELRAAPAELALLEARAGELRAKLARLRLDPLAGPDEGPAAERDLAEADRALAAGRARHAELAQESGDRAARARREAERVAGEAVAAADAGLEADRRRLLEAVAAKAGPELSRLRDVLDALDSRVRQGLAAAVAEQALRRLLALEG